MTTPVPHVIVAPHDDPRGITTWVTSCGSVFVFGQLAVGLRHDGVLILHIAAHDSKRSDAGRLSSDTRKRRARQVA